ncbi:hypothetical protein [Leucothrix arctica]|uniref:Uncharacterized protein n=1 Tax=Leucothrix arctica TaxID=1481894 RepID=A0A317C951_9GAMM|nr:hypothetical protein [Leucothrix arctica]PWQ95048.1 hypothetical protein DKT75_13590 [Leucothrix arctica]
MPTIQDSSFYLKVIDGDYLKLSGMFSDGPEELRKSLVLGYAFDMLIEIGDVSVCNHVIGYLNDEVDSFCLKKNGAIELLGELGVQQHELLLEKYLDSKDQHLAFSAYFSMRELLERKELSEETYRRFIARLVDTLTNLECSKEVAVECALALYAIDYGNLDALLDSSKEKYSEFWDDYRAAIIYKIK